MSDWGFDESGLNLIDHNFVDCNGSTELLVLLEVSQLQTPPFSLLKITLCIFFTGEINADITELFLWHSREFTGGLTTSEPSVIQAACQLRNFI